MRPLARLDLRVAAAVCEVCRVPLSELIVFQKSTAKLGRMAAAKQKRLDLLMAKNNDGRQTAAERVEMHGLVRDAEITTLHNAELLAA